MATSLLSPLSSPISPSTVDAHDVGSAGGAVKSSFLHCTKLFSAPKLGRSAVRRGFRSPSAKASFDHIPKQFREGNLQDGLMENYKKCSQYFYGLSPSQMDMFMTEDNPISRQSERVTEMLDLLSGHASKSFSLFVYPVLWIVPAVAELLVAQFMWLDFDNPSKPIYLYINSTGTQNEKMETVGSETEAYAIADSMAYCKSDVYTVNCGHGIWSSSNASISWSQGLPWSTAKCLPESCIVATSDSGDLPDEAVCCTEVWTNFLLIGLLWESLAMHPVVPTAPSNPCRTSKAIGISTVEPLGQIAVQYMDCQKFPPSGQRTRCKLGYYIELLAKGTGKTKEEIKKDVERPKYLQAQEAIDYGLADKIISSMDPAYEKRNYDEMLAQAKSMRRAAGAGPQAAPSGFRHKCIAPFHGQVALASASTFECCIHGQVQLLLCGYHVGLAFIHIFQLPVVTMAEVTKKAERFP
ncbi:ATP-dependent Clp protease proteolytic subunit-related protein 1, chloroplastic [Vitis vinifera]|uniref:ATP-dependent Clp protease proteolytic subunit-related protein 1, chloroplastic n=1 Tax=Vitis vinifera TaxID=29760 RepID=A0A438GJM9_VITVI|nr:ATP-dependent Clp protease proteolytic subunit-related protein 1, chloroplastic [Vitis vinifera]